jgi:Fur family peroxide stress response transcriptional regulator
LAGLKVTPQRVAVLESFETVPKHPTAEQIIGEVRLKHPEIATGTIYNILDTLVEKGIISRVKTERDVMRYDSVHDRHHHLYCSECETISDYYDEELNNLLESYFKNKKIDNFKVEDIKLQIVGRFI